MNIKVIILSLFVSLYGYQVLAMEDENHEKRITAKKKELLSGKEGPTDDQFKKMGNKKSTREEERKIYEKYNDPAAFEGKLHSPNTKVALKKLKESGLPVSVELRTAPNFYRLHEVIKHEQKGFELGAKKLLTKEDEQDQQKERLSPVLRKLKERTIMPEYSLVDTKTSTLEGMIRAVVAMSEKLISDYDSLKEEKKLEGKYKTRLVKSKRRLNSRMAKQQYQGIDEKSSLGDIVDSIEGMTELFVSKLEKDEENYTTCLLKSRKKLDEITSDLKDKEEIPIDINANYSLEKVVKDLEDTVNNLEVVQRNQSKSPNGQTKIIKKKKEKILV